MGFHEFEPAHRVEIAETFSKAEVERVWRAEDPARVPLEHLNASERAKYRSWETAKRSEFAAAEAHVAKEYGRIRSMGLAPGPAKSDAPVISEKRSAETYNGLNRVLRDFDGRPANRHLSVDSMPAARDAVRRNPRDLSGVLDSVRLAIQNSLTGAARDVYDKDPDARNLEAFLDIAKESLTRWTALVTDSPNPDRVALDEQAKKCRTDLGRVSATVEAVAWVIQSATGVKPEKLPLMITDGAFLYVGAVAEELGSQYAARVAEPSFGLMFARASELPARDATTDRSAPDYTKSIARAQAETPQKALRLLQDKLENLRDLSEVGAEQKRAFKDAIGAADFKGLRKVWETWMTQLTSIPKQNMEKMKSSVDTLAFRLEKLRGGVAAAVATSEDIRLAALAPIDGLISLIQSQTENARELLR